MSSCAFCRTKPSNTSHVGVVDPLPCLPLSFLTRRAAESLPSSAYQRLARRIEGVWYESPPQLRRELLSIGFEVRSHHQQRPSQGPSVGPLGPPGVD